MFCRNKRKIKQGKEIKSKKEELVVRSTILSRQRNDTIEEKLRVLQSEACFHRGEGLRRGKACLHLGKGPFASTRNVGLEQKMSYFGPFSYFPLNICILKIIRVLVFGRENTLLKVPPPFLLSHF